MPSKINQELVRAFNIILCENDIGITNFTVQNVRQSLRNKDYIVISFDKSMDVGQCMEYLDNMKGRIVETFCGNESTASLSFDMKSFPFNFNRSQLVDSNGKYRFSVPIDKGVVFNLKCLLANGLARDVTGAMGRDFGLEHVEEYTSDESFNGKSYLYCMHFYDKRLQEYFIESFSATVKGYKNSPKETGGFLKIKDNSVYIKASIFDNVEFIREVVKRKASLICRDFQVPSSEDEVVESLKFPVIDLFYEIGIPVDFILHTSYTGHSENSILVPMIQITPGIGGKENCRLLNKKEAGCINNVFGMVVLNNVEDCTSPKHLPVFGNGGVYGIDFYDKDISYCVLNKIVESSVINKRHELAIDPELPRTLLAEASQTRGCPKRSRGERLEKHPRQGSEREEETEPFRGVLEIDPSQSTCSLRAWDSSTFLNLEVSNKESEKQQVTDKSDRKSSDEYSEAKSQDSKSPKKHGGGLQSKIKSFFSLSPQPKQHNASFKRHDEGRDTTRSTPETPVTKKSSVSKLFSSFPARIRARSNPSSAVTSPTHEGASGGLKPLTSDERKELRLCLSSELQKELDSNSFSPGKERLLYLTHTPEGKRELSRFLCESKESQLRRLAEAQLLSPDNSSSKRDSGYSSGLPASPDVQHKGSVSSELKHPQQVKHTSEALGERNLGF
ncbi:hypothetical protein INQ25_03250 [Wolbachia endosymbiont of Rhagoletis cerasi]|uniref:hypothetical protein n=1 Tax=Wolbachia endosymbiont of Rhagoletis cerasi TaxID=225363 RepID=UPI001BD5B585|nr:hypothetical protein [Wolbachia endosymbiont of Rhagoletis cerasi]MBS9530406.1 hypothetical protein [Wolbachia endosymbiont of Rhagoletis cerasi]